MSFTKLLDLFHCLAKLISNLLHSLRLPGFSQPYIPWRDTLDTDTSTFAFALLIGEHLPVIKFSDLIDPPDNCPTNLVPHDMEEIFYEKLWVRLGPLNSLLIIIKAMLCSHSYQL
ncbi:hypothetical protein GOBAR_DD05314 [Gossypium barbadense]|nr:hypothetical protein GOBAR_DD05314 [Gossypium barbadense]